MIIIGIIITIGIISFLGYCIIASADDISEEEQRREDEEQLEWLRKQGEREKDGERE